MSASSIDGVKTAGSACLPLSGWTFPAPTAPPNCFDVSRNYALVDWPKTFERFQIPDARVAWFGELGVLLVCVLLLLNLRALLKHYILRRAISLIHKYRGKGDVIIGLVVSGFIGSFYAWRVVHVPQFFDDPHTLFRFLSGSSIIAMTLSPAIGILTAPILVKILESEVNRNMLLTCLVLFLLGSNTLKPLGPGLLITGLGLIFCIDWFYIRSNFRSETTNLEAKWADKDTVVDIPLPPSKRKQDPNSPNNSRALTDADNLPNEEDSDIAFELDPSNSTYHFEVSKLRDSIWPSKNNFLHAAVLLPLRLFMSLTIFDDAHLVAPFWFQLPLILFGSLTMVKGMVFTLELRTALIIGSVLGVLTFATLLFIRDKRRKRDFIRVHSILVALGFLNFLMALFTDSAMFLMSQTPLGRLPVSAFWGPLISLTPVLFAMFWLTKQGLCAIGIVGGFAAVNVGNFLILVGILLAGLWFPFSDHLLHLLPFHPQHRFHQSATFLFLCAYVFGVVLFHLAMTRYMNGRFVSTQARSFTILFVTFGIVVFLMQFAK